MRGTEEYVLCRIDHDSNTPQTKRPGLPVEGLHRWKLQHSVYFVGKQSQDVLHGVLRNSKVGQDGYGSLRISVAIFCSGTRLWFLHLNMYPPTCTRCQSSSLSNPYQHVRHLRPDSTRSDLSHC